MVFNPAGFVPIFDFGAPRIVSAVARETISGGQFVFFSGAAGAVSSGANSFITSDIAAAVTTTSGLLFNGVAINNAISGGTIAVAIDGVIIASVNGTVNAGTIVTCDGVDAIAPMPNGSAMWVGKSLTSAVSGGYALFHIWG